MKTIAITISLMQPIGLIYIFFIHDYVEAFYYKYLSRKQPKGF